MTPEEETRIRERIAELEEKEQRLTRSAYAYHIGASDKMITREDYSKSVLRAQIKGLLFTLNEHRDYLIAGEKKVGEP
jgi:hypothetical protein